MLSVTPKKTTESQNPEEAPGTPGPAVSDRPNPAWPQGAQGRGAVALGHTDTSVGRALPPSFLAPAPPAAQVRECSIQNSLWRLHGGQIGFNSPSRTVQPRLEVGPRGGRCGPELAVGVGRREFRGGCGQRSTAAEPVPGDSVASDRLRRPPCARPGRRPPGTGASSSRKRPEMSFGRLPSWGGLK